ncbi:hypothetical protein TNCV_1350721 [Trichonephila clavipes]|nr:hypothetical protein TNCV_1350721 [Trichonephila clavipes]
MHTRYKKSPMVFRQTSHCLEMLRIPPAKNNVVAQRYDTRKVTDLDYKLNVPGLPTFYATVPQHLFWRQAALHCRAEG